MPKPKIQDAFKSTVGRLSRGSSRLKELQGAVLVAHPENGELVAAVGSTQDFTGFNRALDAKRQVGSLLKTGDLPQCDSIGTLQLGQPN